MFRHFDTTRRQDKGSSRETLKENDKSPPVPQLSIAVVILVGIFKAFSRTTSTIPAISSTVSPFMARAIRMADNCESVSSPLNMELAIWLTS
jgi:hypothetical protein